MGDIHGFGLEVIRDGGQGNGARVSLHTSHGEGFDGIKIGTVIDISTLADAIVQAAGCSKVVGSERGAVGEQFEPAVEYFPIIVIPIFAAVTVDFVTDTVCNTDDFALLGLHDPKFGDETFP